MFRKRKKPDYAAIERLEIELGLKLDPNRPDKLDSDKILPPLINGKKLDITEYVGGLTIPPVS